MTERLDFTTEEKEKTLALYQRIREEIANSLQDGDEERMRQHLLDIVDSDKVHRNVFGLNPILLAFQTAQLMVEEIGLRRDGVLVLSLSDSEASACGAAVREALSRLLGRHRLESASSRGGVTTWQYVFSHLRCDGAAFRAEISKAASFDSVDLFLDRPGGIR